MKDRPQFLLFHCIKTVGFSGVKYVLEHSSYSSSMYLKTESFFAFPWLFLPRWVFEALLGYPSLKSLAAVPSTKELVEHLNVLSMATSVAPHTAA